MGCVRCPEHGLVIGIHLACPHVSQQISTGSLGPHRQVGYLLLCDACMDPRLAPFEGIGWSWPMPDAVSDAYDTLHPSLEDHCVECTAAAQVRYARAAGLPEPWPAFERTLTGSADDAPQVERLRHLVEAFREWPASVVEPRFLTVRVWPGAFTCPLTVEAHGVVEPSEQQALVALVRGFLSDPDHNQAVVRFVEAENWEVTPGGGGSRGPEKLLAEFWLHCGAGGAFRT